MHSRIRLNTCYPARRGTSPRYALWFVMLWPAALLQQVIAHNAIHHHDCRHIMAASVHTIVVQPAIALSSRYAKWFVMLLPAAPARQSSPVMATGCVTCHVVCSSTAHSVLQLR